MRLSKNLIGISSLAFIEMFQNTLLLCTSSQQAERRTVYYSLTSKEKLKCLEIFLLDENMLLCELKEQPNAVMTLQKKTQALLLETLASL